MSSGGQLPAEPEGERAAARMPYFTKKSASDVLALRTEGSGAAYAAMVEIADRCNEACIHCYQVQGQKGELDTAEWERVLDELAALGVLFLTISGGEPTLRKDFLHLVAYARRLRFAVKVYSNALNIDEAMAQELGRLAVQEVQISLYSHEPGKHDAVTRVPGSFGKVLSATRALRANGVRVLLKTPLMQSNAGELSEYIALTTSLDAEYAFDPHLNPREDGDFAPRSLAIDRQTFLRVRQDSRLKGPGTPARALTDRPCGACGSSVHIEANGELRPCTQWSVPTGDVRREPVSNAWRQNSAALAIRELTWQALPGCRACDLRDHCQRCFADAKHEVGNALLPYPMACRTARWHYELAHGVPPAIESDEALAAGASEIGPYRQVGEHHFRSGGVELDAGDRARLAEHAWLAAEEARPAPMQRLVQLRRREPATLTQPMSTPSESVPASDLESRARRSDR
jgi:radical SAM protein with 4Fe4S-binding SPASM domain